MFILFFSFNVFAGNYNPLYNISFYDDKENTLIGIGDGLDTTQKVHTPIFNNLTYKYVYNSFYLSGIGYFWYDLTGTQNLADLPTYYYKTNISNAYINHSVRYVAQLDTGSTTGNISLNFLFNQSFFLTPKSNITTYFKKLDGGISDGTTWLKIIYDNNNEVSVLHTCLLGNLIPLSPQNILCENFSGLIEFNRLEYVTQVDTASGFDFGIGDIYLYNTFNGSNYLPFGNISVENVSCINSSYGGIASYDLNNNFYDIEGDTIYFANVEDINYQLDNLETFDYPTSFEDDVQNFIFCDSILRHLGLCQFLSDGVYSPNYAPNIDTLCTIQDVWQQSLNNSIVFVADEQDNGFQLKWNVSKCSDKRLTFPNEESNFDRDLYTLRFMIGLENSSRSYIYSSYDNFFSLLNPIYVNRTAGKTYFSISTSRFNTSLKEVEIREFLNYNTNTYGFGIYTANRSYDNTPLFYKTLNMLGNNINPSLSFTAESGYIYIDDVQFSRGDYNITFSTTFPTQNNLYKTGFFENNLYVTDNIHLNTDYSVFSYEVEILDCRYSFNTQNQNTEDFNPFIFINEFGDENAYYEFLTTATTYNSVVAIMFTIWVVFLVIMIFIWKDFILAFFLSNSLFFIISIFLGLATNGLVFGILLALSIAPFIVNSVSGLGGGKQ